MLTNGGKQEAYRLRDAVQTFLAEERKRELAMEKTHVTHVNEGCEFRGFQVQRYGSGHDRPTRVLTPRDKAQQRLKARGKKMTARRRLREAPLLTFRARNAVRRGEITSDRHSNAKTIAKARDYWGNRRLCHWLEKRHKATAHRSMTMDKHREDGTRYHLGIQNGAERLFLYRMSNQPLTTYRLRKPQHPYLTGDGVTQITQGAIPLPDAVWLGNAENNETWREIKAQVKAERGAKCERCGRRVNLDLHHRNAKRYGGKDTIDNVELLCRPCHGHTPTFGDHRRLQ